MDEKEILNILSKGENHTTEFKNLKPVSRKMYMKVFVRFPIGMGKHISWGER